MTKKELAYSFWNMMSEQRFEDLKALFHEEALIAWPNTKETFTVEQFIKANAAYPGTWVETVEQIYEIENGIITETLVDDHQISFYAISIFEIKDEKIHRLKEFWSDNGEAPDWRKQMFIIE